MTVRHDGFTVDWLGYATVRIEREGFVAYLDPGRYGVLTGEWEPDTEGVDHPEGRDYHAEDGDLVCVTHDHHYDSEGVERVASEDATVVVYEAVDAGNIDRDVSAVADLPYEVERVAYGDSVRVGPTTVEAVPAYNDPDGPHTRADGEPFHPEGFGCGFLLDVEGERVFWTGDSDVVDEQRDVDPSLFVPSISGSFTMDREGAAALAADLDPDLVLPVHYDTFDALEADSEAFAAAVARRGIPVVLDGR